MDRDLRSESLAEHAFEHLMAEVASLRRSVKALPNAKDNQPTTLPDLGINRSEAGDFQHLSAGDRQTPLPPIWMTPSQHIQFFAVASETLLDREAREFANPAAAAVQERSELADMTELDARPIYRYDLKSREYTVLHSFAALDANGANEDGANPGGAAPGRVESSCPNAASGIFTLTAPARVSQRRSR